MKKTVPYITGDGVGVEITPAMQAIVNAAVKISFYRPIHCSDFWRGNVVLPNSNIRFKIYVSGT